VSIIETSRPRLSVTLVLYNTADFVRDCLLSIREEVSSGFAELVIVDNASPDDSAEIIEREFPEARLIRSTINRGFAGGCNLAWPETKGDYWLLLNPDTSLPKGALRKLVTWMDAHGEIGAGSPHILNAEGMPYYLSLSFPSLSRALLETSRLHKLMPARTRSRLLKIPEWSADDSVDVDWVPGTALIARREAVEQVGLLSEQLFMYGEDVEWCWRMKRAGWRVGVYRAASVRHIGGASSSRTLGREQLARQFARNCYTVDSSIRGARYARLLVCARVLNLALEAVHPLRSAASRVTSRIALRQNINLLVRSERQ
jgi:N-acetylglucosaminyl-diphospho-decaprenol L-rhamnosyltransferase